MRMQHKEIRTRRRLMKGPIELHCQRQATQRDVNRLGRRIVRSMRSHICASPGSQIFYVAALLTESRIVADRLLRQLNGRIVPLVFEFSPKNGHSNLIPGISSTLQFHLLSTWMRVERGSCEPSDLSISFILTQPSRLSRTSVAQRVKEFTVLNTNAPIAGSRIALRAASQNWLRSRARSITFVPISSRSGGRAAVLCERKPRHPNKDAESSASLLPESEEFERNSGLKTKSHGPESVGFSWKAKFYRRSSGTDPLRQRTNSSGELRSIPASAHTAGRAANKHPGSGLRPQPARSGSHHSHRFDCAIPANRSSTGAAYPLFSIGSASQSPRGR